MTTTSSASTTTAHPLDPLTAAEIATADPAITDTLHAGPGWKWGYGLMLNGADSPGGRKAGSGAWAGLFNTHFFIDRSTGICASIYTNSLPFITEHEAWKGLSEILCKWASAQL